MAGSALQRRTEIHKNHYKSRLLNNQDQNKSIETSPIDTVGRGTGIGLRNLLPDFWVLWLPLN
jgi:hypothetical protein